MCVCALTPASGCFTPNYRSETNISQGRADYTLVSLIVLYNKDKGVWILGKVKRQAKKFIGILSNFDVLLTTRERTDSSTVKTIYVSEVHNSLKCHMNITKQTNLLQVIS
jgi:hypothetical protein